MTNPKLNIGATNDVLTLPKSLKALNQKLNQGDNAIDNAIQAKGITKPPRPSIITEYLKPIPTTLSNIVILIKSQYRGVAFITPQFLPDSSVMN